MRSIGGEQPADALPAALRVAYQPLDGTAPWPAGVLAAIRFGAHIDDEAEVRAAPAIDDRRGADHRCGAGAAARTARRPELWFASGPVHTGQWSDPSASASQVRYRARRTLLIRGHRAGRARAWRDSADSGARLRRDPPVPGAVRAFLICCGCGITWTRSTRAPATLERYRQFCVGRGRGLGERDAKLSVRHRHRSPSFRPSAASVLAGRHGAGPGAGKSPPGQRLPISTRSRAGEPDILSRVGCARRHAADLRHGQHRRPCVAASRRCDGTAGRDGAQPDGVQRTCQRLPHLGKQGFAQGVCARSRP